MVTKEFFRRWGEYRQLGANSPREALLDYPAAEWREIEKLLDAALDDPALAEPVHPKPTLSALFRRWFAGTGPGARARRVRNASTI